MLSVDRQARLYLDFGASPELPLDREIVRDRVSAVVRRNPEVSAFVRGGENAIHGPL